MAFFVSLVSSWFTADETHDPDRRRRARRQNGAEWRVARRRLYRRSRAKRRSLSGTRDALDDSVGVLRCTESTGSPLLEPSRYAYVSSVYVHPDARRQGVLRALLRAADEWSRARGLDEMRLHNVADSESAEGAWAALGFQVVEHVRLRVIGPRT